MGSTTSFAARVWLLAGVIAAVFAATPQARETSPGLPRASGGRYLAYLLDARALRVTDTIDGTSYDAAVPATCADPVTFADVGGDQALVNCADQDEVDYYWSKLSEGGEEGPCGWLKDRYGLSWQIVPTVMNELLGDPDPARAQRAMRAMLGMKKLDVAALRAAADQA